MRIGRVLDASDPRVQSQPINGPRRRTPINPDRTRLSPEKALLLRVNEDEGSLTSVDRATLRGMGEVPWDERPGFDGVSYANRHGVSHEELNAPEGVTSEAPVLARLRRQHEDRIPTIPQEPMRPAQENLIERLLEQMSREVPAVYDVANNWYRDMKAAGHMTKVKATEMINRMKHHLGYEEGTWNRRPDWKPAEREAIVPTVAAPDPIDFFEDIPDGYYAMREEKDPAHIKFFRVSTFKRTLPGQARANRKVQVVIGGDRYKAMNQAACRIILREIREAGYAKAGKLYADEIGRCCRCNLLLTDEESRARGMGPTCARKGF